MNNQKEPSRLVKIIVRALFICVLCSFLICFITGLSELWIGIGCIFIAPLLFINGLSNQPILFDRKFIYERIAFILLALAIASDGALYILRYYDVAVKPLSFIVITFVILSLIMVYFASRKNRKISKRQQWRFCFYPNPLIISSFILSSSI